MEIFAGNQKISQETGKFSPKIGFFLKYAFFFLLEIVGFGQIWLNPTRYSRIWSRSLQIWSRSHRIWLVFAGFSRIFLQLRSVRVARVLEMRIRHSTPRCRFLRTETHRRPTGPSVWAEIKLSSGGLTGLSGSSRVWTALIKVENSREMKRQREGEGQRKCNNMLKYQSIINIYLKVETSCGSMRFCHVTLYLSSIKPIIAFDLPNHLYLKNKCQDICDLLVRNICQHFI